MKSFSVAFKGLQDFLVKMRSQTIGHLRIFKNYKRQCFIWDPETLRRIKRQQQSSFQSLTIHSSFLFFDENIMSKTPQATCRYHSQRVRFGPFLGHATRPKTKQNNWKHLLYCFHHFILPWLKQRLLKSFSFLFLNISLHVQENLHSPKFLNFQFFVKHWQGNEIAPRESTLVTSSCRLL